MSKPAFDASKPFEAADDKPPFDPSAPYETDSAATRSDAGPEYGLAFQKVGAPDEAPEESTGDKLSRLLDVAREVISAKAKKQGAEDKATAIGAVTAIPKMLGVKQDLGQLVAGVSDKIGGSDKPLGVLVQDSAPRVKEYFAKQDPYMTAAGEAIGTAPIAPFRTLAAGVKASPFVAKLLAAGGSGLDAAAISGLLGYQNSDAVGTEGKLYDAAAQATLGGLAGTALPLAPEAISSAGSLLKQGAGKALQAPKATLGKLYSMLGGKGDDAATAAAPYADEVTQVPKFEGVPEAGPAGPWYSTESQNAARLKALDAADNAGGTKRAASSDVYDTGAMKAIDPEIDAMGKGDGGPPSKDPEWLKKSGELAKMLGQGADEAAPVAAQAVKPPRGGAPKDPRSRHFKYGADEGKTVLDRDEQIADWDMGMLGEGGKPWFSSGQKGLTPEERAALLKMQGEPQVDGGGDVLGRMRTWSNEMKAAKAAQPAAGAGEKATGQGAADLYQPMGAPASAAASAEKNAAEETAKMSDGQIRGMLNEHGYSGDGMPFRSDDEIQRIMSEVNAQGASNTGGWYKPEVEAPAPGPTIDAERLARGRDRLRGMVGLGGKVAGAWGGLEAGGVIGGIGGAEVGERAAVKAFDKFEKASDKLATLGQKWLTDPAKLHQLKQQGGELGSAAAFIIDGGRTGGEGGMAARAFIVMQQPFYRSWLASQNDDDQSSK